jgi:hypothetical protein
MNICDVLVDYSKKNIFFTNEIKSSMKFILFLKQFLLFVIKINIAYIDPTLTKCNRKEESSREIRDLTNLCPHDVIS